jgi:hypothetical protein
MSQSKERLFDSLEFRNAVNNIVTQRIAKENTVSSTQISVHEHTGRDMPNIHLRNLFGMISVMDAVPTYIPKRLIDQIVLYVNGATKRLYIYDYVNEAWLYVNLT